MKRLLLFTIIFLKCFCLSSGEEASKKGDDWVLFIKKFGKEKVFVKFPLDPKLFYLMGDSILCHSEEGHANYSFVMEPRNGEDAKEIFRKNLKEMVDAKKVDVEKMQISQKKEGTVLDVVYSGKSVLDTHKSVMFKQRILVTKENVYRFSTQVKDGKDSHDYFIQSFLVE